jgi:RNA polymerase sigma factor (sigma-70 family)
VEDVLQETYLRAYGALSSGAFERRARVDSWLTRIALNAAVDVLRRNRRRRIIGIGDVNDDFALGEAAPADAVVALRQLAEALDRLPEAQRAAFVLTQVEGMSAPEAGDALGCTTGAVEQRVGRARAALRRWLA